jgi:signal peptidase
MDDANTRGTPMEPAKAPPRTQRRWIWRVISLLILAGAAAIVIGLLALTVGPKIFPYQALVVRSGSMSPTIPTGSVVFYHKVSADQVKVGQIIVFARPGLANERVTHRVYRITKGPTGTYFTTKGDANGSPDDWQVPAVGTGWVAGFHVPVAGYVLADLQSTTARLLLLLIPAFGLGLITLTEIWRDRGKSAGA